MAQKIIDKVEGRYNLKKDEWTGVKGLVRKRKKS